MSVLSWLVPYRKFTIESGLTPDELVAQIRPDLTRQDKLVFPFYQNATTPYVGTCTDAGFKVRRAIRYRNSFLPFLFGKFDPIDGGTRVTVTMRPFMATLIFMIVWLSFVGCFCIGVSVFLIPNFDPSNIFFILGPFVMFAFGVGLTNIAFGVEAKTAERWIRSNIPPRDDPVQVGPYR